MARRTFLLIPLKTLFTHALSYHTSLQAKIGVEHTLAGILTDARGFPIPLGPSAVLAVASKLFRNIQVTSFLSIHHITTKKGLVPDLEGRVVLFAIVAGLLLRQLCVLCVFS